MIKLPVTGKKILSSHFQLAASTREQINPPSKIIQILGIEICKLYLRTVTKKLSRLKTKTAIDPIIVL